MSKKDYEAIAKVISIVRLEQLHGREEYITPAAHAVDRMAYELAEVFSLENPRFDRARFLAACKGE